MGNDVATLLLKNGVSNEEFVVNALADTNLGTGLVLESAEGEAKRRESLVGLSEEGTGLVDLEVVGVLEFALVDSGAGLSLLGLTFAC